MSAIADTTLKITNTKLYVPIVTLSAKYNVKLSKQVNERSGFQNEYKTKIESKNFDNDQLTRFPLDALFQGVRRLLVLAFDSTNNGNKKVERKSHTKYFLPRVNIINYNVLIDGRNSSDQPVNDQIKKYCQIRKTATGQGDYCTTWSLLDYQYFKNLYQPIAVDLSKQKKFNAVSRASQQIEFYEILKTDSQLCAVLEKSKETTLEF